ARHSHSAVASEYPPPPSATISDTASYAEQIRSTVAKLPALVGKGSPPREPHGSIMICGGLSSSSSEPLTDVWTFTVASNTWSALPDVPALSTLPTLAHANHNLYVLGGSSEVGSEIHRLQLHNDSREIANMAIRSEQTEWSNLPFPTNPLAPGPRPRKGAGMLPVTTGNGRLYILYFLGQKATNSEDKEEIEYWSDTWSYQVPAVNLMPAGIKDKTRSLMGISTGEGTWAEVKVVPNEEGSGGLETEGKSHPGPRGWFASCVLGKDFDGGGVVIWGGINAKGETEGEGWIMANLTSLLYHKYKSFQSSALATAMPTKDIGLPTSSRSGHPIYTFGSTNTLSSTTPANEKPASHCPTIEISPNGTWKSVTAGRSVSNIEHIDLTSRFSYTSTKNPKAILSRPKNAIKKGLRPTKSFELPSVVKTKDAMAATRKIYRQHSPSIDDDEEDVHSEPSPSKSKSMMSKLSTDIQDELPAILPCVVVKSTSSAHKRRVEEISSDEGDDDDRTLYEATPPRRTKVARLTTASDQATLSAFHNDGPLNQTPCTDPHVQSPGLKGPALHTFLPPAAPPTTTHNPTPPLIPEHAPPLLLSPPTNNNNNTILRFYLPRSPSHSNTCTKTYIPLRLQSCPDNHTLFSQVSTICDIPLQSLSVLRMHFDAEDGKVEEEGKGVMGVKKDVEESFVCFVRKVMVLEGEGRGGGVAVEVEVVGVDGGGGGGRV
ncbi:MAG: hypothetical protein L6R42_007716, partial [Xanthoria sp. 1 TBL-2021]